MIANILVSVFSKGFGTPIENEDDGTLNTSEDASGTGMGEGVGLNDVSDQITDEDQLLGTREQVFLRVLYFCVFLQNNSFKYRFSSCVIFFCQ